MKNSKGENVKFERAKTKTQKTRNYNWFLAFDKAKEALGETDVVVNAKLPIRSVIFKEVAIFEQSEFQVVGNCLGSASEWKFNETAGKRFSKDATGKTIKPWRPLVGSGSRNFSWSRERFEFNVGVCNVRNSIFVRWALFLSYLYFCISKCASRHRAAPIAMSLYNFLLYPDFDATPRLSA